MSVSILPAAEQDVPAIVRVELEAFRSHPRIPILWPQGYTQDVYAFYESKKYKALHDPNYRLLKAVGVESGNIVGASEVTFALDPEKNALAEPMAANEPPPENWPTGGNWTLRRYFIINSYHLAKDSFAGKPFIEVELLVVDPQYQGRGIGSKLIQWSIHEADKRGIELGLESSPAGLALYQRHGFEEVERIKADMRLFGWTQPYDEDEAMRVWMIRQPSSDKRGP